MSRARDDEMTFVLLERDQAAPATIRFWCAERIRLGKNRPGDPQIVEAMTAADTMDTPPARVTAGGFAGALVRVHFTNPSGFLDCRFAQDFGPHKAGEIVVLYPSDIQSEDRP